MKFGKKASLSLLACAALTVVGSAQAAGSFNLFTDGSSGVSEGATYTQMPDQPTGTGFIDSFVRVQTNQPTVKGYNTTVDGVFDNKSEDNYNHQITVGQVGVVTVGGANVMRFLLDINQTGANPRLNLDDVQIFISKTPNQAVTTFTGGEANIGTTNGVLALADSRLVYRMDTTANNTIGLDFSLNSGSGSGDMYLDVPLAMFTAAFDKAPIGDYNTTAERNAAYIYLYSKFGSPLYTNNDGFEEWAYAPGKAIGDPCIAANNCGGGGGGTGVPEPASLALVALGMLGIARARRRKV